MQTSDAGTYICLVSIYDGDMMQSNDESFEKNDEPEYYEALTIILRVRSVPGPVSKLSVRLSTILGVLMWEFSSNHSNGYPVKSFTAEFRKYFDMSCENATIEPWERLEPNNIPGNVVKF